MNKKKCFKCGYWNKWDALYCGLCYEPFNKRAAAEKPAPAGAEARPEEQPRLPRLLLLLAGLTLAVTAAFRLLSPPAQDAPGAAAGINRFSAKTAIADKLLEDYTAAKEALLARMGATPAPEGFGIAGEYTAELFRIEEEYAAGMEALRLPGAGGLDRAADSGYLLWLETHRYKENSGMEDFSRRYRLLAAKAGAGG
ncbi:MAG: hypothetical protein CVU79_06675 [Elusimicrobia bacterium HGW-Elusimicrobia-3]|nr:MAG: hypothetical protein CVU79_06675 [Elusimicrobia bacterium HGW-Elusimicrobia-3]